jgi:hypothetical protein
MRILLRIALFFLVAFLLETGYAPPLKGATQRCPIGIPQLVNQTKNILYSLFN